MTMDFEQQQARLRELITHGKKQGFVTYTEINDYLLEDTISEAEQEQLQLDEIVLMLNELGIPVCDVPPDMETLLSTNMSRNSTEEESNADNLAGLGKTALGNMSSELGRTTDPVRIYMREMGTVELLNREGEIKLAKRIEEGLQATLIALAAYPQNISYILDEYTRYERQEIRLNDIVSGFLDQVEFHLPPESSIRDTLEDENSDEDTETFVDVSLKEDRDSEDENEDIKSKHISSDEEGFSEPDGGPDPELTHTRFMELKTLHQGLVALQAQHGHQDPRILEQAILVSDAFSKFKLVPRQLDRLIRKMRSYLEEVRVQERIIMRLCVNEAKMPRRVFIDSFPKHETDKKWIKKYIRSKKKLCTSLTGRSTLGYICAK